VVGGGIGGLSSARFFHQAAGKGARVLVLENHDDVGVSVRQELHGGIRGGYSIESPAIYGPVAKGVIGELGIDVSSYARHNDEKLYRSLGLTHRTFFDWQTFGEDRLVIGLEPEHDQQTWNAFATHAPLTEKAKADVKRLYRSRWI
jgi:spermidine dehydrogenase